MNYLELERFAYLDEGTFGKMTTPAGLVLYTVERPWKGNERRVSCIPEGDYQLFRDRFNRGGYDVYQLADVPGRDEILIHIANWPHEVMGCIGVGLTLNLGSTMVGSSRAAFAQLMEELDAAGPGWVIRIYSRRAV